MKDFKTKPAPEVKLSEEEKAKIVKMEKMMNHIMQKHNLIAKKRRER